MSPRAGLDRTVVVEEAAVLADEDGFENLSLARLAERLGVRKPSLYNHIAGLDGIRRELVLKGLRELGRVLSSASSGEDGEAGIFALAEAYRSFIKEHPGLYAATVMSYRIYAPDDHELGAAEGEALQTVCPCWLLAEFETRERYTPPGVCARSPTASQRSNTLADSACPSTWTRASAG